MLFTISSVFAVDSEIQAVSAHNSNETVVSTANDDNLKMNDANEILAETDDFNALYDVINGDPSKEYVELDKDYHGTYDGGNGIQINRANVVIDGKGHTIDCTGENSRMFNIRVEGITLKNITFTGGNFGYGGAIYTNKYLTIIDCTFENNQATGTGSGYGGGALYGSNAKMSLYNSTFINNHAALNGGVIAAMGQTSDDYELINCTFIDNVADNYGGVFYSGAYTRMGNIINSTFISNRANVGDVIFTMADNGAIDRCVFINNTAKYMIYGSYVALILNNSIIVNNDGPNQVYVKTPIIDNNWWGTTVDDSDAPVVSGKTLTNYYVLDMKLNENSADITLNNLYDNGVITTSYEKYALPSINFTVKAKGIEVNDKVSLGNDGTATIEYDPADAYVLTIQYNGVELTREVKPTFKLLKDKINAEGSEISLDQDYEYDSTKDASLTNGIEFAKDMTIDGQGHIIDAKELTNIFYFDDDTKTKSLTLKNIIFANAAGLDGGAVYFKGNKIEIINCTFIKGKANSQGDAIYVVDAASNANKITESIFSENSGENSIVYVNLDSPDAKFEVTDSIFIKNAAAKNIKATGNVIADYNWWGNTAENNEDISKTEGVTLNNWLFLKIDAEAVIMGNATLSLNNVYDDGEISTYDEYALKPLSFDLGGSNAVTSKSTITLNESGQADYQFRMDKTSAALTASLDEITTSKELEYTIVDDGSFKALNDIIWFSNEGDVIELTHNYVYSDSDTITEGINIPRAVTINGNGYTIDAKGKTRIFDIIRGVCDVTINDINFINGNSTYAPAISVEYNADNAKINNCNFTNNTATNYGGAIGCVGDYCTINNCNFINNTAKYYASAIYYNHDTQAYIKNSNFFNNTITDGSGNGGVIHADDGSVTIDKSTFINNSAQGTLGAVLYSNQKQVTITNSILLNNTGATNIIYRTTSLNIEGSWFGNTFVNQNIAPNNYYINAPVWLYLDFKFTEENVIISLNNLYAKSTSSSSVYANYNLPEITLNLNSTNINLNTNKITLDSTGKAVVPYAKTADDAALTVSYEGISLTKDCQVGEFDLLQDLIDTTQGNTIELNRNYTFIEGTDTLTNGVPITRDLTIDGKGHTISGSNLARIFYITTNGVTLKNINFVNGLASHGGAIYNNGGSGFKLINCTFNDNVANANPGGAIYLISNGVNDFINCTFIGNKITANSKNGGAIYIYENSGQNNFIGCTFINNTGYYGGAIATYMGKAITNIDKSVFITNTANYYSSIYIAGGSSAEFYLNNSIIFSKGFTTDTSTQVRVNSNLCAGDVNNNWWMHTVDTKAQSSYVRYSGGGLTVTKYLFLDMNCENEIATISINNLYDKSSGTVSTYDGELPQITFDLSGVNVDLDDNATLNKNGVAETEYALTDQTGSITAAYNSVSITKDVVFDDSFNALQNKINRASEGSEVVLKYDYNYDDAKDSALTDGIVIDKDLTIDGQGFTIDAKDASRIFKIDDSTKNIVLKNIRFTNASADNGAAVYAICNSLEIINCSFESNQATGNGDAVYVVANECSITESFFAGNLGTGSVLYLSSDLQDASFNIDNSILVGNAGANIAKDDKIALTANNNWWGNTVENTDDLTGGVADNWYLLDMAVDDAQSIATITLNNLWDGSAYNPCESYALPAIAATMKTNDYASVRKNKVIIDKDGDSVGYIATDEDNEGTITVSCYGASITKVINYNEESDYSFKALKKLIESASDNDVIVLPHDYEYVINYDDITSGIDIVQCNLTIIGNGHTIDANGKTRIFNVGNSYSDEASNLTIKNTVFTDGKMSNKGGAILWYGNDGKLENCTFKNNTANNNDGGAVYWEGLSGTITNSTFIDNKANRGAAVCVNSNNITIDNSTFINSVASNLGGAIYWAKGDNANIINSTFADNRASSGGAIYLLKSINVTIIDSTFVSDISSSEGGAIYWRDGNNRKIINSTFRDNRADQGGAIYWNNQMGDSYASINDSTFVNNTSPNGGAIYIYAGSLDITKNDFINNTATGSSTAYGGAIYSMSGDPITICDSKFIGNLANAGTNYGRGGALYISAQYGSLNITDSIFVNNSAYSKSNTAGGGAMYIKTKCNITNSTFIGNSANAGGSKSSYGGVFYWDTSIGNITYSRFIDNSAKTGAVIYGMGSASFMNVTNSIIINNKKISSLIVNVLYRASGNYNFTDCWFGNTENDGTDPIGLDTSSYVKAIDTLSLYADHEEYMAVGEDRDIDFVFKYFKDGAMVVYDASKLPEVNLTLSATNGVLNSSSALVGNTVSFNANHFGDASITAKYNGISYTQDLYAKQKVIVTLDEEPVIVHVGEHLELNGIHLDPNYLSYTSSVDDGDEYIALDANYNLVGLKEGQSILTIKTSGDDYYAQTTVQVPVTVIKYTTQLVALIDSVPVDSIAVGWGTQPQQIQIAISSDDPYPDYSTLSLDFASNDTKVAKITTNPVLITFGAAGFANITISTEGNEKYYASKKNITLTVRKVESEVIISPMDVVHGASNSSIATVNGATAISAKLYDGDAEVGAVSVDGLKITVDVGNLDVGTYTLNVTTVADENHTAVSRTASVNVIQAGSDVIVPGSTEVVYSGSVDVSVVVPEDGNASGVSAKLYDGDAEVGAVSVDGLKITVDVGNLDVGTYTLKVTTITDKNHAPVTKESSIIVIPAGSDVTVPGFSEVVYGDSVDVSVVVPEDGNASGVSAKLYDGDAEVLGVVSVDGLKITVDASNLDVNEYTLKVTTITDTNHAPVSREGIIKVTKKDSSVSFSNDIAFAYQDEGSTIATCSGCTIDAINVTVIDHPEALIDVEGNKITVSALDEGEYTLKVITTPINDNYKSIESTLKVSVSGISPKMSMQVTNITVGENETVFVMMDTAATGIVNITIKQGAKVIASKNITINNLFNKTVFSNLKVGEYTITAHYYGSQNYNELTIPDEFIVRPIHEFEFSAVVNDTVWGNKTNATVKISSDATGSIQIGNVEKPIEGSVTVIELPVQEIAGKNNVCVKYIRDENSRYADKELVVYYNVAKKSAEITIADISDIKAGSDLTVAVSAYEGADIVIYLDGEKLESNTIENISAGTHTIIATAAENSQYLKATANKTFTVTKTDIELSVSGTPAKVNEKSTINVVITEGVTGTVIVNVNGTVYELDASDIKPIEVTFDKPGSASLSVKYLGDYKFNAKQAVGEAIAVTDKDSASIEVKGIPSDIRVGDSFEVVIINSTPVVVYVDGVEKTLDNNGKLTIENVKAGRHNITVAAKETPDFYAAEVVKAFEAFKNVAAITIDPINVKAGDGVNVVVSAYEGAEIVVYVDGVNTAFIDNISAGNHTVVASVKETDKYLSASANYTFEVTKTNVGQFIVRGSDTKVGEKSTITLEFSEASDVTGIVVVNVDGTEYSLDVSKSKTLEVVMNKVGSIPISAKYLGNYKYNSKQALNNPIVVSDKTAPSVKIEVNPESAGVGDNINIKVTTDGDNLTVWVNGDVQKTVAGSLVFTPAKEGTYTIIARTTENATHWAGENVTSFSVTKKSPSINVTGIDDVKVGEQLKFSVTTEPGNPIVKINNMTIEKTRGEYVFTPQASGTYTLTVETKDDGKYADGLYVKTFTVDKNDLTASISANPVKVGQYARVTLNINNEATGIVVVNVDGTEYSLDISKSKSLDVLMNRAASIQVSAKYMGDNKYNACDAGTATIEVSDKTTPTITIEVGSQYVVGDNINIKVSYNGYNLTVAINGVAQKIADGNIAFTPAKDGAYTIIAKTTENDDYYAAEKVASFSVINKTKLAPSIKVSEIKDAVVDKQLTFTVSSSVEGALVKIDGKKITPVNGIYRYTPQKGGVHVLTVETPEDAKTSKGLETITFDVAKKPAALTVDVVGDLVVDKNIALDIKSYDGADIVVYMDGKQLTEWETPFKTTAGEHMIIASVAENDKYLSASSNKTFTVAKKQSSISVSGDYAIVGEATGIDVILTEGATGMVIVNVDGTEYSLNLSQSNSLSVVLSKAGRYDVSASYLGDDRYMGSKSKVSTLIVEDKKQTTIDVYTPNAFAGEDAVIEVISNSNSNLEVYFDGEKQTLANDKFTVKNINAGVHEIKVVSPETSGFQYNSTSVPFAVDKRVAEITINLPKTITVGNDIQIEFKSYDGANIAAYIDGVKQTLTNAKTTFKATAGVHTIVAGVAETDKYLEANANKTFAVSKLDSQIAVSGKDITEGQTTTITIDTTLDEGMVIVNVGDISASVDLAKAKSVDVKLDAAGTYELSASYLGSDRYKSSEAAKSSINVSAKQPSKVDVSIPEIKAGETKPITVSIPGATGDVHVILDGIDNVVPLDKNGKATFTPDKMTAGQHSVAVVYGGDDNNAAGVSSKSFDVEKQQTKASITAPSNVKEGESATVKVSIPDAAGEVSVIVDGKENRVQLANGEAQYQLNNVSGGEHSVVVIYPGDETHDATYAASSFNVAKKPVIIPKSSEFSDITIDDDMMISFILKDEDGNAIWNAVIKYNDGSEKTTKTDYHGKFTIQAKNNVLITIRYDGNETISGTATALKLNIPDAPGVVQLPSRFNIDSDVSVNAITITGYAVDVDAGEEGMTYSTKLLDANGKPIANVPINFAVNNKIYNRTTHADGGFDPYNLNMIRAGRYTMAFHFSGNENYSSTIACVCVDLAKKPITIKAGDKSFKASTKTKKYTITLSTTKGSSRDGNIYLNSGKKVTLTVNGKKYTATTNSKNKATFKITGLNKKGTYAAEIEFRGDKTYDEKVKSVILTVK